jgi:hypothetical protein
MSRPKKTDNNATIDRWCSDVREELRLLWVILLDGAQHAIRQDREARHWFGLEISDLDKLLAASESDCGMLASHCLHPFRPARQLHDIFGAGQTKGERAQVERLDPAITAGLRIMWSGYLFRLQWLMATYPEIWLFCGLTEDDAATLRDTPALTIQKAAMRGPYTLVSSLMFRGLLSYKHPLRQSELLRRIAADLNLCTQKDLA